MKRLIVAVFAAALVMAAPSARAQAPFSTHNEISTSYGISALGASLSLVAKYANLASAFADFVEISDGANIRVKAGGSKGVVNLGYAYQINKTWQFGISAGYNRISVELSDNTGSIKPLTANLFTIMNTAQVNWFRTASDMFGMYSKAAAGVVLVNYGLMVGTEDERTGTRPFFSPHLTAVGLEVGRDFRGFMELGVGMQGILQMGIKARF